MKYFNRVLECIYRNCLANDYDFLISSYLACHNTFEEGNIVVLQYIFDSIRCIVLKQAIYFCNFYETKVSCLESLVVMPSVTVSVSRVIPLLLVV